MSTDTSRDWVLLLFHLPTRPTAARVRTWRRLQHLGAMPVRNSGYALPFSDAAQEDFEWLRADIRAAGGDGTVFVARATTPDADAELRAGFLDARRKDFEGLKRDAARLTQRRKGRAGDDRARRILIERLAHLDAIDFFGAGATSASRAAADAALHPAKDTPMPTTALPRLKAADYRGRTWVTRPRPGIDRCASAWLIRRFIDPRATFRFMDAPPTGRSRAVPFDMFGVEFGHQDGGCTFDTLVRRFGIAAPRLSWLADLVRTVDLKLDSPGAPEAAAVARMVDGLRSLHTDDKILLERGIEMIEALYRSASDESGSSGRRARR